MNKENEKYEHKRLQLQEEINKTKFIPVDIEIYHNSFQEKKSCKR